jgi:Fic family protein
MQTNLNKQTKYKASVLSPISKVHIKLDGETEEVFHLALEDIVRFDSLIKEKAITMPAILLRSESASSSQIERLTASAKNIAIAEIGGYTKDNAIIVASNISAMKTAMEETSEITLESILKIHKILCSKFMPEYAGKFREEQVWVGAKGNIPHTADFVPPHHLRVHQYMEDFIKFIERNDIHPIVLSAIAHAQFETIHPFADGNGRVGRTLIQAMLANKGIIRTATIPISAGLLANKNEYYQALNAYRAGDCLPIIRQICISASKAVNAGWETAGKVEKLRSQWLGCLGARRDSVVWKVVDYLFEQPVINAQVVSQKFGVADISARSAIETLLKAGIIKLVKEQKRNVLYFANEITDIMDNFSKSIARRSHV